MKHDHYASFTQSALTGLKLANMLLLLPGLNGSRSSTGDMVRALLSVHKALGKASKIISSSSNVLMEEVEKLKSGKKETDV